MVTKFNRFCSFVPDEAFARRVDEAATAADMSRADWLRETVAAALEGDAHPPLTMLPAPPPPPACTHSMRCRECGSPVR